MPQLDNNILSVTLDDDHPRPLRIAHKATGAVFECNDPAEPFAARFNLRRRAPAGERSDGLTRECRTQWRAEGDEARFTLEDADGFRLEGAFRLEGGDLVWTLARAESQGTPVQTVDLVGADLARLVPGDVAHRDIHETARWDRGRGKGLIERRWETFPVAGTVPEYAPKESIVAGGWSARAGVSLFGSQRYLPFLTQFQEGAHPCRTGWFRIAPNTVYLRVRGRDVTPVELRIGVFGDLNGDGAIDRNEVELWHRRRHPDPDPLFRERLWYKIFLADAHDPRMSFGDCLELIRKVRRASDGMPQIAYLVGWQYDGHDTGYPALDRINEALGAPEELAALVEAAKELDTIVSVHINLDDAYAGNPAFDPDVLCRDTDGQPMPWEHFAPGLAYHICHTLDVEKRTVFRRLDDLLRTVPLERTVHIDAFRSSNRSWGPEGYIGPMEELVCGLEPILADLRRRGLEPSIEAIDRQGADHIGYIGAVWHITEPFLSFGKTLGGAMGNHMLSWALGGAIDCDLSRDTTWETLCDHIYLGARLYYLYLTDELVAMHWEDRETVRLRFARGGETYCSYRHTPHRLLVRWDGIEVARDNRRFLPAGEDRIYVYGIDDEEQHWRLPASWEGARIAARSITPWGETDGPELHISGREIRIPVAPRRPIRLEKIG